MTKLGNIITQELFLNAYEIIREYYKTTEYIVDVNLRVIRPYFETLSERKVKKFYQQYISSDLIYALPELCSSEPVSVPKNMTGVREYRFMSTFSHILFVAYGLVFVECTTPLINSMDFKGKGIYSYFPTRFTNKKGKWKVVNKYREEYANFTKKLHETIEVGDVVIKTDIAGYFENISHSTLVEILSELSTISILRSHGISDDANFILEFYLNNLMQKKTGIPQGRKNFASDFFGYLYLVLFDNEIRSIVDSKTLKFKACIRYVDDTYLVFNTNETDKKLINKEILNIEQRVSSWIFTKLGLNINPQKTKRRIISDEISKEVFIHETSKSVSQGIKKQVVLKSGKNISITDFKNAIIKLRFPSTDELSTNPLSKDDRESLKYIFSTKYKKQLLKSKVRDEIFVLLEKLDIEMTVDEITIILPMFFNGDNRFENLLEKIINQDNLDIKDRRIIHILMAVMTRLEPSLKLRKRIEKGDLYCDSYGKYLPILMNIKPSDNNNYIGAIPSRLFLEHNEAGRKTYKLYIDQQSTYNRLIYSIVRNLNTSEPLIQSLKLYQFEVAHDRWDTAFNHIQSVFHEIMKCKYNLGDDVKIQDIAKHLDFLSPQQELLLRKFYDRRNFNPISHSGKKGQPAEKVGYEEFIHYRDAIIQLLLECFAEWD